MLPKTSSADARARVRPQLVRRTIIIIIRHWDNNRFTRAGRRARHQRTCAFYFAGQLRDVPIELPGTELAGGGRTRVIKM